MANNKRKRDYSSKEGGRALRPTDAVLAQRLETLFKGCGFDHPVAIKSKALVESVAKEKTSYSQTTLARKMKKAVQESNKLKDQGKYWEKEKATPSHHEILAARVLSTHFAHDDSVVELLKQSAIEHFLSAPVPSGVDSTGQDDDDGDDDDDNNDDDNDDNDDDDRSTSHVANKGAANAKAKGKEAVNGREAVKGKEAGNEPSQPSQPPHNSILLLMRAMKASSDAQRASIHQLEETARATGQALLAKLNELIEVTKEAGSATDQEEDE